MNRLRIIFLSLLVLATIAGALPAASSLAKWSRNAVSRHHRRHRRHSRAWWRRHRAVMRARRERAEQRRLSGNANAQIAAMNNSPRTTAAVNASLLSFSTPAVSGNSASSVAAASASVASASVAPASVARSSQFPFDFTPPHTWTPMRRSRSGEAVFAVRTPDGRPAGTAIVAPVSLSGADLSSVTMTAKTKTVGGVALAALRRTVINRMVAEGGWVTNDFVQESQGRRVFVVLAQTGSPGAPAQSWTFYFTEIDGRVYSLATTTPVEFAEPVAAGSEQFLASLRSAGGKNLASQK